MNISEFCNICQTTVKPIDSNFERKCPNCMTPMNKEKRKKERSTGFGTDNTSSKRKGVGWG